MVVWFGFYGISTIAGYLKSNPLYTYIVSYLMSNPLYTYIVSYLMSNPLYTYILNIYDLVGLRFMAYQPLLVISFQILFIHVH